MPKKVALSKDGVALSQAGGEEERRSLTPEEESIEEMLRQTLPTKHEAFARNLKNLIVGTIHILSLGLLRDVWKPNPMDWPILRLIKPDDRRKRPIGVPAINYTRNSAG